MYKTSSVSESLASQLKALSDPARLRILALLPHEPKCEDVYNVTELAEALGTPQPTVSHHLAILKRAGLIRCEKMCRDVYYWLDPGAVQGVLRDLTQTIDLD